MDQNITNQPAKTNSNRFDFLNRNTLAKQESAQQQNAPSPPKKTPTGPQPFQKVFIDEHQILFDENIVTEYRRENQITIQSQKRHVPQPFIDWKDAKFPDQIQKRIHLKGFARPTPIQSQVFPIIMSGKDCIGIAQTGSGKTCAFLLPGLVHINAQTERYGPSMLVLAPTRELAMQIHEHVKYFQDAYGLKSACIYGGADRRPQEMALCRGVDIIVATPGRLIDFLESRSTTMKFVTYLVLDEADRMLDMGFEPQVRQIADQIRVDRQTVFFSATWPRAVQTLACDLCHNDPINLYVGATDITVNKDIDQEFTLLYENEKIDELNEVLDQLTIKDKVLIFVETKRGCEDLSDKLTDIGYFCMALHGDKSQQQRDFVMREFKTSKCKILCATDVASRGLDVRDITLVINYDFPNNIESYVHRIGRTGRAGDKGKSVTFITFGVDDNRVVKELIDLLLDSGVQPNQELYDFANSKSYKSNSNRQKKSSSNTNTKNRKSYQQDQKPQFNSGFNNGQPPTLVKKTESTPVESNGGGFGFFNSKK